MVAISALISIFPAFFVITQAFPTVKRSPPHMNGEEARALAARYNPSTLHTRQESLCQQITIQQLDQMTAALNDAEAYATANWGGGWNTIAVNPTAYPGNPAQACYPSPMQFTAVWSSNPTCEMSTSNFTGTVGQGSNSAEVQIYQGTSVSASTTVETATTLGESTAITASVTVGIPDVEEFQYSVTETVSVSVTNTKGSTTTDTNDARTTVQDTVTCSGPANVEVAVNLQTCSAQGNVNIPVTLGGWVWFYYGERKQGHYEWAVNLDGDGVSSIADRQQNVTLSVNANTNTYGTFYGNCSPA